MSLMSKLLTTTLIATVALNANNIPDKKLLLNYVKRAIVKNPQVKVDGVTVIEKQTHKDLPGWDILLTTMDLTFQNRKIHAPEIMFIKDGLVTGHLVQLKTGHDYRDDIKPTIPESMYNDAHLLYGNKDAAHKVIVFSDPVCPFCQQVVPGLLKAAKEHPDKIALYYYHLPLLNIHPVSDVLTRVMHIAQTQGKNDVVEKMYSLKISPRERNATKILSKVKAHTGFAVSQKQIDDAAVKKAMADDEFTSSKMMVRGTPTIYIDGKVDKTRNKYKQLIK